MKLTDQALRQLIVDQSSPSVSPELDLDLLVRVARGELKPAERDRLARIMADSPVAVAEYQLARSIGLTVAARPGAEPIAASPASTGWAFGQRWALAASLLLVVGLVSWVGLQRSQDTDVTRGSAIQIVPPDGAELTARPSALAWPHQSGVNRYQVEIIAAKDGRLIWRSESVAATQLELPRGIGLVAGHSYQWRVLTSPPINESNIRWYSFSLK